MGARLSSGTLLDIYAVKKDSVEYGGKMSVAMGREGKEGVMEAVMEKEGLRDRICRAMKPICNCFSVAARQAREAEIDFPSSRRFRQMFASEEGSVALPQDEGAGANEVMARTKIGVRAFMDCLGDVKQQVEQSRTDAEKRMSYRRLPE